MLYGPNCITLIDHRSISFSLFYTRCTESRSRRDVNPAVSSIDLSLNFYVNVIARASRSLLLSPPVKAQLGCPRYRGREREDGTTEATAAMAYSRGYTVHSEAGRISFSHTAGRLIASEVSSMFIIH